MSYRSVLVCFDGSERADSIMDVAIMAARKSEAHLIGLFVIPQFEIYSAVAVQIGSELLESHRKYFQDIAAEISQRFEERARKENILHEWRCVDANRPLIADTAIKHALTSDLVVVGQSDPENTPQGSNELPERLLLESGRPVLVVPYAGTFATVGDSVLVAWSDTRESARAAFDAVPLMTGAKNIKILAVNKKGLEDGRNTGGDEIALALARHGLNAETSKSFSPDLDVGDELLSRLADTGSDLLVMGGYGHSRLREAVFGGVTKHILSHMTVPVLMSH